MQTQTQAKPSALNLRWLCEKFFKYKINTLKILN